MSFLIQLNFKVIQNKATDFDKRITLFDGKRVGLHSNIIFTKYVQLGS